MALITTWHPTYAFFHQPFEWGTFTNHLDRFARLIRGELAPQPERIVIQPTLSDVRRMAKEPWVTVDVETAPGKGMPDYTGKDPTRCRLKSIGIGCPRWGFAVWMLDGPLNAAVKGAIKALLLDKSKRKVFHNGWWFDLRVLARHGFDVAGPIDDTRDMRRALVTTSALGLEYITALYDDAPPWFRGSDWRSKDWRKLLRYNAEDCVRTARCYVGMLAEEEWSTERVQQLYCVHTRLSQIAAKMHTTGFWVHKRNRAFMHWCLEQEIKEKEEKFLKLVDIPGMRCTPNDLRKLLFKKHETEKVNRYHLPDPLNPKLFTKTGLVSVKEDKLLVMMASGDIPKEIFPVIDAYWDAEQAKKRMSFIRSQKVDEAIGADGRLRPGWNSCGTDTMRFSCSEPNIMNIEQGLRAYLAPAPGKVIVHADKSQLELRVMAAVAPDDELQRRLDIGDVYSEDAKDWYKLPRDMDVKKLKQPARRSCKIIHLASQYAAGVATIHAQALKEDRNFSFTQTRLLNAGFKQTYHMTVEYWNAEMGRVHKTGYSEGRLLQGRRNYPRPPPITEVANWPIQRTASEMMAMEMIALDDRLTRETKSGRLIGILHDAFDVECDASEEKLVEQIMQSVMDREVVIDGRRRKFPVEIKVTRYSEDGSWADV